MNNPSPHCTIGRTIHHSTPFSLILFYLYGDVFNGFLKSAICVLDIKNLNSNNESCAEDEVLTQFAVLTHLYSIYWGLLTTLIDTHGHINSFGPMLVAHKDAVFSRILCDDIVDSDAATLWFLTDGELALVNYLLVIPQPGDLWRWFTIDEACQTQRLKKYGIINDW